MKHRSYLTTTAAQCSFPGNSGHTPTVEQALVAESGMDVDGLVNGAVALTELVGNL